MRIPKYKGSAVDVMIEKVGSGYPMVGEGATIRIGTDQHAYTVREVHDDGRKVIIQRCDPKRVDTNGMDEYQEYDYSDHIDYFVELLLRKSKWTIPRIDVEWLDGQYEEASKLYRNPTEFQSIFYEEDSLELKTVRGFTKKFYRYPETNIKFGIREEYRDFSF